MRTDEARLVETRRRRKKEEMRGDQNRKMISLEGLERICWEVNEGKLVCINNISSSMWQEKISACIF